MRDLNIMKAMQVSKRSIGYQGESHGSKDPKDVKDFKQLKKMKHLKN